ncbi:MAG: PAS domain S-box protein [Opitutales bacterium]|nr:PAS domain S-box protein [Opitutales bacterium]
MYHELLIDFVHHIALLLAIALVFDLCINARRWTGVTVGRMLTGFLLGLIGIALMLVPLQFAEGIQFDARSVVLALSGLFFGFVPTVILAVMTILFRIVQGGMGATVGVLVILASGILGLLWRHYFKRKGTDLSNTPAGSILSLGITVHVVMLALMFTMPREVAVEVVQVVGPFVLVLYPFATVAVGVLLRGRLRRQKAMDDLRENRDHYRKLTRAVEQSPASVVITDTAGGIEYVNPKFTEVTGYSRDEVIGENPRILKSGDISGDYYKEMWRTIKAGNEWQGEFLNRRKDGSTFWEIASISPIVGDNGQITAYLAVKEDVTEKKRQAERLLEAKEEAERANRAKSSFLAVVSHELRTPLNGIIGPCQLALETARDPEEREMLETALNSSKQLLHLIERILSFAEIESGSIGVAPEEIDLRELVASTVLDHSAAAEEKGIGIGLSQDSSYPPSFISDPAVLRQVLLNLVENAVKFTDKGYVSVTVREEGKEVSITVADTGCGIAPETLDAVFGLFNQGDMSVRRVHEGIGLGLSIAKVLTERLGGRLQVESEPGKGSVFTLRVPRKLRKRENGFTKKTAPPARPGNPKPAQKPA